MEMAQIPIAGKLLGGLLSPDIPAPPAAPPPTPMVDEEAIRQARRRALAEKKRDGYESTLLSEAGKE